MAGRRRRQPSHCATPPRTATETRPMTNDSFICEGFVFDGREEGGERNRRMGGEARRLCATRKSIRISVQNGCSYRIEPFRRATAAAIYPAALSPSVDEIVSRSAVSSRARMSWAWPGPKKRTSPRPISNFSSPSR